MRVLIMALALIACAFLINVATDLSVATPRVAAQTPAPASTSVEVPPPVSAAADAREADENGEMPGH